MSGLDGATDYRNSLVGTLLGDKMGVMLHLKARRELFFEIAPPVREYEYVAVTHDVLDVKLHDYGHKTERRAVMAAAGPRLIVGLGCAEAIPRYFGESDGVRSVLSGADLYSCRGEHTALAIKESGAVLKFAFAFSPDSAEDAVQTANEGLELDVDKLTRERLAFYDNIPTPEAVEKRSANVQIAYKKAFSVLRGNVMSAEGSVKGLWTTTCRVPHRNLWLWDSVFHSFGWRYFDNALAARFTEAVLDNQDEDGYVPLMAWPYGVQETRLTQPPLLAWGLWRLYEQSRDVSIIERNYEKLKRYIRWDLENRDANNNGLCEWFIEGDVFCRSGESGADNSARFDKAKQMDAVDFSSFIALEAECLSKMAAVIGNEEERRQYGDLHIKIKDAVNNLLWSEKDGIYYDRVVGGDLSGVKALSCFFPMLSGIPDERRAKRLVEHLTNPDEFYTAVPFPADARCEPTYGTDMWRGGVWLCYNYLVVYSLWKYGYAGLADEIAERTIETVMKYYYAHGCMFEFFDSSGEAAPLYLDRKGKCNPPYDIRLKYYPIRDYGWTSSLFIAFINGDYKL